jgi:hypothetical protein
MLLFNLFYYFLLLTDMCLQVCVSVRFEGDGRFLMCNKTDGIEVDITAKPSISDSQSTSYYLDGRITENVRPLCFFDRPGVLLALNQDLSQPAVILQYDFKKVAYSIRTISNEDQEVDPLDMERMVCKIGQSILIKPNAITNNSMGTNRNMVFVENNKDYVPLEDLSEDALLLCKLRVPDDDTLEGFIPLDLCVFPNMAAEDDMMMDLIESMSG